MNNQIYLSTHAKQAAEEEQCFWRMIERMKEEFIQGNYDEVTRSAMDALNSMKQLEYMQIQKRHHDSVKHIEFRRDLDRVIVDLQKKGVLVAKVRWPDEEAQ
ncbi:hypothetical protein EQV77_00780 [Halobacillus fulvus]|nr:hypothetical protein EQV77_00780 [Halobacillus fulvus]